VLIFSSAILIEVKRVLTYPHVQARWPLADDAIDKYLEFMEAAGVLIDLPKTLPAVVSDPDDDPILQTAILGKADVLCNRDVAFRHEVVERVCAAQGVRILDDIALMKELRLLHAGQK